ncbi:mycothiol conjugate amidase Mca [Brevibacterium sandarakinum]|uniref:mycothiol conjugate amidase Mca n=1 Tax=Brevibacterium sandarakinum TaxID=629680 RepID=UPI0026538441|nr:mycothiol conjugate amidase Mca [Brevibacterium sandarakinum]MDN5636336.1 mycothiol conjugate amidase Mca [Brevibacterium sp.]MDN5656834.1 mycothiol conjugate amidase Mca [Brevibacterium sandarakinum]
MTSLPYHGLRLLTVHAHPDDESSKGAATSAKYASLGARVLIASMTGGEAGDILNPALLQSPKATRDIAGLRREEMASAAAALGAEHVWVGHVDSGLPDGDFDNQTPPGCFYRVPDEVAMLPLVHIIRSFRPQVVTTYDELGGYPHPDHIKNHAVTMAAVAAAADPEQNPELGEPWQVEKVYFNQDLSAKKWVTIHEKMTEAGLESPFADHIEDFKKRDAQRVNWLSTTIDCVEFFASRDRALLSHATQIDPEGGFFSASRKAARTYWPTEEFELAVDNTGRTALTPGVDFQETDLFASVTMDDGRKVPAEGMLPASPDDDDDEAMGESA